ncbi:PfkB family carbohydrate kinase [Streptomyces sp. NPDC002133]|uniref:PfkB family carbohydrate kinase n=1 Tax=Streptomyces sp. NPDC002133 TaxID=3154409 RepID=UPI00332C7B6C
MSGDRAAGQDAVLVLGEALIDLVPVTRSAQRAPAGEPELWRAQPGGAPANVAVDLARLGTPAAFAGGLGGDGFARTVDDWLRSAGVDTGLCARSSLPTALAVADPGPEGNSYHFHLRDTATFSLPAVTKAEMSRFGAVYAGGLAAVVQPAAGTVAQAARAAAEHGLLVVDPNVRAEDDGARRLLAELCASAHVVKASDEDLARLWPGTGPEVSARRLADEGRLVVMTLGARGSTAFVPSGEVASVPAVPVDVVNTIGAGDAFMAGMLAWLGAAGLLRRGAPAGIGVDRAGQMLAAAAEVAATVCALSDGCVPPYTHPPLGLPSRVPRDDGYAPSTRGC